MTSTLCRHWRPTQNSNETRVAVYTACASEPFTQKNMFAGNKKNGVRNVLNFTMTASFVIRYLLPAGRVSRKEPYFVAMRPKTMAAFTSSLTVAWPL